MQTSIGAPPILQGGGIQQQTEPWISCEFPSARLRLRDWSAQLLKGSLCWFQLWHGEARLKVKQDALMIACPKPFSFEAHKAYSRTAFPDAQPLAGRHVTCWLWRLEGSRRLVHTGPDYWTWLGDCATYLSWVRRRVQMHKYRLIQVHYRDYVIPVSKLQHPTSERDRCATPLQSPLF